MGIKEIKTVFGSVWVVLLAEIDTVQQGGFFLFGDWNSSVRRDLQRSPNPTATGRSLS